MTIDEAQCAKYCLAPHPLDKLPPRTPNRIRKWRKSNALEPGKRVIHPALTEDLENRESSEQGIVFGCKKKMDEGDDDHVNDLWSNRESDEYHSVKKCVFEATYKSKPLGRSYTRGHKLPEFMLHSDYRHGVTTSKSDDAKQLIYANASKSDRPNDLQTQSSCIASQGGNEPGQQRRRNYNWPVDPESTVFGIKGEGGTGRGRSVGVSQALQMKNDGSNDGGLPGNKRAGNKMINSDTIFGISTAQGGSTAAECLGHYKGASRPDAYNGNSKELDDLGKSVTPGFRNAATEYRCFGCPSVRTDIPKYERNSVADNQNYGDDVSAGYLLRPTLFSSLGLDEDEFCKPRSKEFLNQLFQKCGATIDPTTFDEIFDRASDANGCASIESFRDLNELEMNNVLP